jgi:uracil-DNA glycosylase
VAPYTDARVMLVGQAPGVRELERRAPFMGRSGSILMSWMARAGFASEAEFRRAVYLTAVTKCYPGKAAGGNGDRRPSPAEIALCRPFLERQLALVRPWLIIPVGRLAIERFLGRRPLEQLVGRAFDSDAGRVLIPLPHPSGASRWMNDPAHRALLERALRVLKRRLRGYLRARRAATEA